MDALKYLDVIFVALGAVIALVLGAPSFGVIVGAAGWILQRVVRALDHRWAARLRDPQKQVGVHLFESFGRIWLLAGAIVVAGAVGHRQDGLAAAVVIFATYSVAFAMRLISGPPPERELEGQ